MEPCSPPPAHLPPAASSTVPLLVPNAPTAHLNTADRVSHQKAAPEHDVISSRYGLGPLGRTPANEQDAKEGAEETKADVGDGQHHRGLLRGGGQRWEPTPPPP